MPRHADRPLSVFSIADVVPGAVALEPVPQPLQYTNHFGGCPGGRGSLREEGRGDRWALTPVALHELQQRLVWDR